MLRRGLLGGLTAFLIVAASPHAETPASSRTRARPLGAAPALTREDPHEVRPVVIHASRAKYRAVIASATVLERIKRCESGGRYTAQNPRSTASGAYQFLDSSWNGRGGYLHARDAPPEMQE
jgi:hypothetical protein